MARNHCQVYRDEHVFNLSDYVYENNTLVIQPISKIPYLSARYIIISYIILVMLVFEFFREYGNDEYEICGPIWMILLTFAQINKIK